MSPSDPQVVLVDTGEPLYQLVTRRDYIETLDRLLDSIDLDIAVVNRLGKVIVWNAHLARSWAAREAAIGSDIRDLFPQLMELYRGYRIGEALIDDVIGQGKTIDLARYPMRKRSGAMAVVDFKAYPLRGRGEEILGAVLVMADVSETVELEQQLVRSARTTSLARLGASVAHEIRNPLNSLQLNIELIREGLAGDGEVDRAGLLETTELLLEEARRINDLVTHFMEFARPAPPSFAMDDPGESARLAIRLLAEEAKQAGVAVDVDVPPLPFCRIDRRQIQQVIYNIALNALQLTPRGGRLSVKAWAHPEHVAIRLTDSGPGIPPEALDQLFDLFYSTREGGTGLGLPIAHRIVEAHDGKLHAANVDAASGTGAVFTVYLPRPLPDPGSEDELDAGEARRDDGTPDVAAEA